MKPRLKGRKNKKRATLTTVLKKFFNKSEARACREPDFDKLSPHFEYFFNMVLTWVRLVLCHFCRLSDLFLRCGPLKNKLFIDNVNLHAVAGHKFTFEHGYRKGAFNVALNSAL